MYWPTEDTFILLLIGVIPIAFLIGVAIIKGLNELLSLRFVGVLFIWIGYHLSPWASYFTGLIWDSYLLVPQFIDDGLLFSTLCMAALLVGYQFTYKRDVKQITSGRNYDFKLVTISTSFLSVLAVLCVTAFIIRVGGIDEVWVSSYSRGEGQFLKRDVYGKLLHISSILSTPLQIALGVAASIYILQRKNSTAQILGWACLFVASFSVLHGFSRGAGMAFVILAFVALRLKGKRGIGIAIVAIFIASFLGSVGYTQRGGATPGLGNFITAAEKYVFEDAGDSGRVTPIRNPLDAMAPFTRKVLSKEVDDPDWLVYGVRLLWNQNPLPSEFFPLYEIGRDLSKIMGTYGHTGITTPALAEIYYVFGYYGSILYLFIGSILAWFERQAATKHDMTGIVGLLLVLSSCAIGLHSGLRAMTRPLLYGYVMIMIIAYMQNKNIKKSK